jgi:dipeptidyl aminopeptidase/acylaminoacyl peptidase
MMSVRSLLSIGGVYMFCALLAVAAPPRRIPIEDFCRHPQFASAKISPDGKRIAFLAPDHNRMNIWVCDAGEPFDSAKLITGAKGSGIREFQWTRDSHWLVYSQDSDGDENFHLFRVDPSAPEKGAVDLTPVKDTRAAILHLPHDWPAWAWIQWNNRDPRYFDLGMLDITNGAFTVFLKNIPISTDCLLWNADGRISAHGRNTRNGKFDIMALDSANRNPPRPFSLSQNTPPPPPTTVPDLPKGNYRTVATYSQADRVALWGFSADQSTLYLSSTRGSNTQRLTALDIKTGEETVIDQDPEYDLSEVFISERTHQLLGTSYEKERFELKAFDPQFKRDLEILSKTIGGPIHLHGMTEDEQKWIVATESPIDPGSVYLYDRSSGAAKLLYRPFPWLKSEELSEMKPIAFESRDGWKIHGYLSLPSGVEPHGLPTILVVHGGPWERDKWGYHPGVQFLANRGYAVLQINFRGSTGYGARFCDAGRREWGGKMVEDLIDGAEWILKEGIADPKRLGILGASYGGYAALSALAFHPKVFACGVDISGPSDLVTFLRDAPPYWANWRSKMVRDIGDPVKDADFLRSQSPLFSANKIEAPLFIAQGENDPRVKRSESDQMVEALRKNGKPVEYLLIPDEGHGFEKPEDSLELLQRIEVFLEEHLK